MAQSEQEILEGLAEIVNEETGLATDFGRARQELHRRPRHRLAVDDDDRRQRRGEVRRPDPRRRRQEPQDRPRRRRLHRQRPGLTSRTPSVSPGPRRGRRAAPAPAAAGRAVRAAPHRGAASEHCTPAAPLIQGAPPMTNREQRIVVTGLGATTPLGGDVPETWDAVLDGQSGARTMTDDWVAQPRPARHLRGDDQSPPEDSLTKVEIRRLDPSGAVRADRRPRGLGRRRHARGRARAARRRRGLRHRRRLDAAVPVRHPAARRARAGSSR